MKSLARIAVNGLALVGAFQIYKEFTTPQTSDHAVADKLDNARTRVHHFTRPLAD